MMTASAAIAAPLATPAAPAHPDAVLLAACVEYHAAFAAARRLDQTNSTDAEWLAAERHADGVLDRIEAIPAVTLSGVVAKARAIQIYRDAMLPAHDEQDWTEQLAENVLGDLLRLA